MRQAAGTWTDLEALGRAAECLRVLAHAHRLRMIQMLLAGDYAVGELAEACGLPPAMASEHLRLMMRCGFLTSRREGRSVFYRVAEPHLKKIMRCVEDRFDPRRPAFEASAGPRPGRPRPSAP